MRTEYDLDQTEAIGKVLGEIAFELNDRVRSYDAYLAAFVKAAPLVPHVEDWGRCKAAFQAEVQRLVQEEEEEG
jgi:hypothetical protein